MDSLHLDDIPDDVVRDLIVSLREVAKGRADTVEVTRTDAGDWDVKTEREVFYARHEDG